MAVVVGFRERRHNYSEGIKWAVDDSSGRLFIYDTNSRVIATYNTGVWDHVTYPPVGSQGATRSSSAARRGEVPAGTVSNNPEKAWNATLKPSIDVDFKEGE